MYTGATGSLFRASLVVSSTAAAAAFYLNKPPAFCQNSDGTPRGALTLVERQQAPSVFLSARESNRVNMLEDSVIVLERQCAQQPLVRVSLEEMVDDLRAHERRLLLFGEQHDDGIAQEVERAVYDVVTKQKEKKVALALEFLDADARPKVAAFNKSSNAAQLQHHQTAHLFQRKEEAARYGPLVAMAKNSENEVIAANCAQRHVSMVAKAGASILETLSNEDRDLLPPLPLPQPSPGYLQRLKMLGFSDYKIMAQCLWDSAMAHSCLDHISSTGDAVMLVCGRFHLEHFMGIFDHIELTNPGLERETFRLIVCVPLSPASFKKCKEEGFIFNQPGMENVADFIVLTRGEEREEVEPGVVAKCPAR